MAHRFRCALLARGISTKTSPSTAPLLWQSPTEPSSTVQLLSWGRGSSGQLGGGIEEIRFYPSPLASLLLPPDFRLAPVPGRLDSEPSAAAVEVGMSCGLFHSSLLVDGGFWIWGKGDGGRLGLGHENSAFVPTRNPNLDGVKSLALGGLHSAALTRQGDVFTWGYGGFGALGHSVYTRELLPRLMKGSWTGKISHLATSGTHTAAVSDLGSLGIAIPKPQASCYSEVYTWGRDEGDGRLGLGGGGGPGEGGALSIPSKVAALPVPISSVTCGGFFTMALTSEGQLWSWGANSNYELGRGDKVSDWRPRPVPSLGDIRIIQIASGGYHSLALTDQGRVFSWGHGGHGQLGHASLQSQKVPVMVEALNDKHVVHVACEGSSSAAITDEGKLYMWGNSRDCQLGVPGLPEFQPSPVEVKFLMDDVELGPHHVLSVSIGASHAMCLVLRPGHQT